MFRPRPPDPVKAVVFLVVLAICALAGWFAQGAETQAPDSQAKYAVVRLESHGASATIIATGDGYTWLLGCAHAYKGEARTRPMTLERPTFEAVTASPNFAKTLVDVDYEADLSLVLMRAGPVPYVCPVAPTGVPYGRLLSVGYDEMRWPATEKPATIVGNTAGVTWTREMPWHGRSGGGLIDTDRGMLVGVVQGYEVHGQRRGMYVSLDAIHRFLNRQAKNQIGALERARPQPQWVPRSLQACPT